MAAIALTAEARSSAPAPAYQVQLRPTPGSAARGSAAGQRLGGTSLKLAIQGLPPDPDTVYEVECDGPKGTESAGTFRADAKGHATWTSPPPRAAASTTPSASSAATAREYDVLTATLN